MAYTFQWKICDSVGQNCAAVPGETAQTFGIPNDGSDDGKTARCTVTRVADGLQVTSPPTVPITTPGGGSVVYAPDGVVHSSKTWNDGLIPPLYPNYDAEGWQGPNAYDAITGGAHFGHFELDSIVKDEGAYSARFVLPADTQNLRTVFLSQYPGTQRPGLHEYFSDAVYVPSSWPGQGAGNPQGLNLWEANAFLVYSAMLAGVVGIWNGQLSLLALSASGLSSAPGGTIGVYSGTPGLPPHGGWPGPFFLANPMQYNTIYQYVIHVYWSWDNDGLVEGWVRRRNIDPDFTKVFSHTGFPTLQWGTDFGNVFHPQYNNSMNGNLTERLCTYTGGNSVGGYVIRDSYSRCSTLHTAFSRFGSW